MLNWIRTSRFVPDILSSIKKLSLILEMFIFRVKFYGGWWLGMGIGDWGLGIGPNPQSPIPNPQSPIPI